MAIIQWALAVRAQAREVGVAVVALLGAGFRAGARWWKFEAALVTALPRPSAVWEDWRESGAAFEAVLDRSGFRLKVAICRLGSGRAWSGLRRDERDGDPSVAGGLVRAGNFHGGGGWRGAADGSV